MSQRYFGRPLAGEEPPELGLAASALLATVGGVLVAAAVDPAVLAADTRRSIAGLLLAPA